MELGSNSLNTLQMQSQFAVDNSGKAFQLEKKLQSRETRDELMKTARQFEGVFIQQLLQAMDKTVDRSNSILSGGSGEESFRQMMYEKISEDVATRPGGTGFGLAEMVYKQLEKQLPKTPEAELNNEGVRKNGKIEVRG